jgi:hypothetical protein
VELTGAEQANISKHLVALAEGGLVRRRKVGTSTFYAIADAMTLTLCDVVCAGLQERFLEQARALGWTGSQQPSPDTPAAREDVKFTSRQRPITLAVTPKRYAFSVYC